MKEEQMMIKYLNIYIYIIYDNNSNNSFDALIFLYIYINIYE